MARDVMPAGLHRTYGAQHLRFITNSCYRRLPFFNVPGVLKHRARAVAQAKAQRSAAEVTV